MSIVATLEGAAGGILSPVESVASGVAGSAAGFVLQGISSWVLNGTKGALEEVANAIGSATAPNLDSTWFSSTYWRVAALATMLTIPFLCAAAVQAIARTDLGLLARVTFAYLPLSILGVSLAAPMTMLLLAATDQMSAAVSASAAGGGAEFLDHAAAVAGGLAGATGGSPFFAVIVGLLALMAAMALAVELLVRAAAVYVVVLMLPLAFAAMVWPARRIWGIRLVELLASLILSKFVIVAVLSLAAAAFTHGTPGIGELLVAMSLILLSTFSPWVLMRILPFTELASGAAGILSGELPHAPARAAAASVASGAGELAMDLPSRLRDQARAMYARTGHAPDGSPSASTPPDFSEAATAPDFSQAAATPDLGQAAAAPASSATAGTAVPEPGGVGAAREPGPDGDSAPQTAEPDRAAQRPPAGQSSATPEAVDDRGPFRLPEAWLGHEPVRLDAGLLRVNPRSGEQPQGPQEPLGGGRPESAE
jgi:hypothetical protein